MTSNIENMNLNSAKYVGYIDIETIVLEKSDILLECNHSSEELERSKRLNVLMK